MAKVDDLFTASARGDVKAIDTLLEAGMDIDSVRDGDTALHAAIKAVSLVGARHLIEKGANLNAPNRNKLTPLMHACSMGEVKGSKIAMLIIAAGCDTTVRRASDGMSALELSVKRCTPEVIESLIATGLPVDGPKGRKLTPAMIAAREGNTTSLGVLLNHGCDLSIPCQLKWAKGMTCMEIAELEKKEKVVKILRKHPGNTGS